MTMPCQNYWFVLPQDQVLVMPDEMERVDCRSIGTMEVLRTGSQYENLNGPVWVCERCARIVALQNIVNEGIVPRGDLS